MPITLTSSEQQRCMQSAARAGFNPLNSHLAYAKQANKKLADKARRVREPLSFNVIYR